MKLVRVNEIFDVEYGNQLDLNKLEIDVGSKNICFISRTSQNNGVSKWVKKHRGIKPYEKGLITVTLGGTYLLSSFVQQQPFYTAQNVKVLDPKEHMTLEEKLFYCIVIGHNRFRYTSHGREANKTLDSILIPSRESIPEFVYKERIQTISKEAFYEDRIKLNEKTWKTFKCNELFAESILLGKAVHKAEIDDGEIPYITRTALNNGVGMFGSHANINLRNSITIGAEGIKAFYQENDFITGNKVNIIRHEKLNKYNAIFLCTILDHTNIGRFNYGYAIVQRRLKNLSIKLPATEQGLPDWQFMEDYIKSLPYSSSLMNTKEDS